MEEILLADLKPGSRGKIVLIKGGRKVVKRLADLGLSYGTEVEILRKAPFRGAVEIKARNSKLVLGRGLASKILIKPLQKKNGKKKA